MPSGRLGSLFSQRFDRAVLASYVLGGVLPIAALVWVVHQFVLPSATPVARTGWIVGVVFLALLSLAVYFALRRITEQTVARMAEDNRRLTTLLTASRELGAANQPVAILASASDRAREVGEMAHVAFLLATDPEKPLELRHADTHSRAWFEPRATALLALAEEATADGAAASQPGDGGNVHVALAFQQSQSVRGALLLDGSPARLGPEALDALATIARMAGTALQRGDLEDAQRNFFAHVTELLVTALDGHVVGRHGHATNVARLANRIAHEIGLPQPRKERLHFAAVLHDVGMLKIEQARHIDAKAFRAHPLIGARLLSRIRLWEPVAPLVLDHHEWWDGSGYPGGKSGEAIPLESRIIALADAVDAMARSEGNRRGKAPAQVVDEVVRCRGTQFDPALVDAFVALHERGEAGF